MATTALTSASLAATSAPCSRSLQLASCPSTSDCNLPQDATWPLPKGLLVAGVAGKVHVRRRGKGVVKACGESERERGEAKEEEERLAREFMKYVNKTNATWPGQRQRPTALMSPAAIVQAQMDALMRNDWPEESNGILTAFSFSMPNGVHDILGGKASPAGSSARTWEASETFLSFSEFEAMALSHPYKYLINCNSWELASPVTFHGRGDTRSVQAVRVLTGDEAERAFMFTFCLEKVTAGAYKGCWMVVGVRCGDYANV